MEEPSQQRRSRHPGPTPNEHSAQPQCTLHWNNNCALFPVAIVPTLRLSSLSSALEDQNTTAKRRSWSASMARACRIHRVVCVSIENLSRTKTASARRGVRNVSSGMWVTHSSTRHFFKSILLRLRARQFGRKRFVQLGKENNHLRQT